MSQQTVFDNALHGAAISPGHAPALIAALAASVILAAACAWLVRGLLHTCRGLA